MAAPKRRTRANGDWTVYQRKDGRWEAAGYVLAPGNTRKPVRVYDTTRTEALTKLTEKIAASNRGLPIPSAQGTIGAYLTYWLENVAVQGQADRRCLPDNRYGALTEGHRRPSGEANPDPHPVASGSIWSAARLTVTRAR